MTDFDVVVVGSGPGGAVTAQQCALAGLKVAVIEKGGRNLVENEFGLDQLLNNYKHAGMTTFLGKNPISYVEGSVLGGGSVVNAGLYHRTPKSKITDWINSGCIELDHAEVEGLQLEVENTLKLEVTPDEFISDASFKLASGAKKLKWECINVPRWYVHSAKYPKKNSMNELIHQKLATFPNVEYFTRCEVLKLAEHNDRVILRYFDYMKDYTRKISARYVFLCAGAIDSPLILKMSGYLKWRKLFVGCHPSAKVITTFKNELKNGTHSIGPHQVKEFFPDFSLGCSVSSPAYVKQALIGSCDQELSSSEVRKSAVYYANIDNKNNRLLFIPFLKNPIIRSGFSDSDFIRLKRGIIELARVAFEADAECLRLSSSVTNVSRSLEEFTSFIGSISKKELNLMTIHLFSSLPMGPHPDNPIAYGGLLKGTKRIYVNDASIFPSPIGANPQGTVMMLALNNVRKFLKESN